MRSCPAFPIPVLLILLLIVGCSPKNKSEESIVNKLEASLLSSNKLIHAKAELNYHKLEQKLTDPIIHYKALVWYPKATEVYELSGKMIRNIQNLKEELTGNKSNKQMLSKQQAEELSDSLRTYKENLINIDSTFKLMFDSTKDFYTNYKLVGELQVFDTESLFDKMPVYKVRALLSQFENSIYSIESMLIDFCDNKCSAIIEDFYSYSAIIGQSTNYLKAGDKLEMIAGIGQFENRHQTEIFFNQKSIPISDDGAAHYTIRAPYKAGKYSIPVIIRFDNEMGRRDTINKTITYTVLE